MATSMSLGTLTLGLVAGLGGLQGVAAAQDSTSSTARGSGGESTESTVASEATSSTLAGDAGTSGASGAATTATTTATTVASQTERTTAEPQTEQPVDGEEPVDEEQRNNDRMLNLAIIGLLVVAALIAIATILFWRSTAPEPPAVSEEDGADDEDWFEAGGTDAAGRGSTSPGSEDSRSSGGESEPAADFPGAASVPLARSPRRRVTSSESVAPVRPVAPPLDPSIPAEVAGPVLPATAMGGAAAAGLAAGGSAAAEATRRAVDGPPAPGSYIVPSPDELAAAGLARRDSAAEPTANASDSAAPTRAPSTTPAPGDGSSGSEGAEPAPPAAVDGAEANDQTQPTEDGLDIGPEAVAASIAEGEDWAPVPGSFRVPPPSALPTPPERPFANVDSTSAGVSGDAVVAVPIAAAVPGPTPTAEPAAPEVDEAEISIIAASLLESAELPAVVRRGPRKTTGPWGEGARIGQQPSEFPGLPIDPDEPSFSRGVRIVPAPTAPAAAADEEAAEGDSGTEPAEGQSSSEPTGEA
jgi:hypothetical protein